MNLGAYRHFVDKMTVNHNSLIQHNETLGPHLSKIPVLVHSI